MDTYDNVYTSTCNPSGWVTVGLIIKNGFDKNGNPCIDTAWYHHMFRLFPMDPNFKITRMNSGCGPWTVKLTMNDSIQDSLKTVTINFNNQQTITLNYGATDSIIPSQYFTFTTQGLKKVTVTIINTRNCSRVSVQQLAFGFIKTFTPRKETVCVSDSLIADDLVQYFNSNYSYWRDKSRAATGKERLFWDFGEGGGFNVTGSTPSYKYAKPGNYRVRMVAMDSLGCTDTVTYSKRIKVVDMVASIKPMLPRYLCAPQILRFNDLSYIIDSSSIYGFGPYDSIVKWTWEFGENKNPVFLKNPVYDYTSNGLFTAKLKVTSYYGCEDTASTPIFIDGPAPSFTMSDTLGCSPLTINFTNTTGKPLINWIWFFRDYNNSIASTQRDTNVSFTYNDPGIFKVYLLGEDTLFDPIAGIMKTCRSVFPDSLNINAPLRRLRVTESVKSFISGPDTVCVGVPFELTSQSKKLIPGLKWNMGDGILFNSLWPDSTVKHTYNIEGDFWVSLLPQISGGVCVDSSWKMINVGSVEADFEFDESKSPSYQFNNLSKRAIRYEWNFGQVKAGSANFSTEKNPFHTYLPDTGTFTICLKSFNNQDCYDSICKTTQGKVLIVIPNVFTPNGDDKNDAFDIDIQGGRFYDLKIFNRWGDIVYLGEKDGLGNDGNNWNGKSKNSGPDCPDGVYYFVFTYRLLNMAENKTVHGSITLLH
jgi:gliding motility-associated-like protein